MFFNLVYSELFKCTSTFDTKEATDDWSVEEMSHMVGLANLHWNDINWCKAPFHFRMCRAVHGTDSLNVLSLSESFR